MKKKSMILFVILFTLIFSIYVSVKYFDRNKSVNLSEEFSVSKNQVVRVANKERTSIKLLSISLVGDGENNGKKLLFKLSVNGEEINIIDIPSTIKIYDNGELYILEGDEDRLIMKVVEN